MILRRRWLLLVALSICGVLWRVVVGAWLVPAWEANGRFPPFPDDYPALAESLLTNGQLGYGLDGGATLTTVRGPGFPLWVALGILLGGESGRWLAVWSSIPMLALAAVLVIAASKRFGILAGLFAYCFLVFHPLPSFLSARVLSDEFFSACGFGSILLFGSLVAETSTRRAYLWSSLSGLLLSLAMLTRSSGVFILATLLIVGVFYRIKVPLLVTLTMVSITLPLLWSLRSSILEGRPVFVHSLIAYNFWIGEGFERYGYGWTGPSWRKVTGLLAEKAGVEAGSMLKFHYTSLTPASVADLERRLGTAAREYIADHPMAYSRRFLRGVYQFWLRGGTPARSIQYGLALVPAAGLMIPVLIRRNLSRLWKDPILACSALVIFANNLSYAAILPMARFSVQVYPEVAWLACAGAGMVLSQWSTARRS